MDARRLSFATTSFRILFLYDSFKFKLENWSVWLQSCFYFKTCTMFTVYLYWDMLFLFHIWSIYDIWTTQVPTPLDCDFPPYYAKVLFPQQCHLLHKSCIPCNQTLSSTHFHISGATAVSLVISLLVLPDLIQLFRTVNYITLCETIQGQPILNWSGKISKITAPV